MTEKISITLSLLSLRTILDSLELGAIEYPDDIDAAQKNDDQELVEINKRIMARYKIARVEIKDALGEQIHRVRSERSVSIAERPAE